MKQAKNNKRPAHGHLNSKKLKYKFGGIQMKVGHAAGKVARKKLSLDGFWAY
jgi:hypothetical protein